MALLSRENPFIAKVNKIAEELGINDFPIISIRKKDKSFIIFYISNKPMNDWYDFRELAFMMNKTFNKKFILKHINLLDGSYAVI